MGIVTLFPPMPAVLTSAAAELRKTAAPPPGETADAEAKRRSDLSGLPRPWSPGSCDPELRAVLYPWLDDVARWLNDQYCWQPKTMIPACWPRHPHIAHELAVVAFLRHDAEQDITPIALHEWHRYSWPLFVERMLAQLDEACRTDHITWPARARFNEYCTARSDRDAIYAADAAGDT